MNVRFFPVSVCVRGDTGIPDRLVIEEINKRINGDGIGTYELQALDPAQFVVSLSPEHKAEVVAPPFVGGLKHRDPWERPPRPASVIPNNNPPRSRKKR